MAKRNISTTWQQYPAPQRIRSGCKVSWYIYAKIEDARLCAAAAEINAETQRGRGYDFGYCSPGSICQVADGWEVCIP